VLVLQANILVENHNNITMLNLERNMEYVLICGFFKNNFLSTISKMQNMFKVAQKQATHSQPRLVGCHMFPQV
jgi:hypothetical protein